MAQIRMSRRKLAAIVAALALEAALVWALVTGLAQHWAAQVLRPNLTVTTVTPDPPPQPPPRKIEKPAGAAAPEGPRTKAAVVPPPKVALASPTPAAPAAGTGASGTGSGAGGTGSGSGAGGSGPGSGSGVAVSAPTRIAGALSDRDYPRDAGHPAGTVGIAFRVRTDGAVDNCRVIASSGLARLDTMTCALVEQRFRYRPARDGNGQPVEATLRTSFTYGAR